MVSPEILRRYPPIASLAPPALQAVAMLAQEEEADAGTTIVEADTPADAMYVLREGAADLSFIVRDIAGTETREHFISEINPGELFGISALIPPHTYRGRVRARARCRVLRIDGPGLRALCELDERLALELTRGVAEAAIERLHATELQLAAARP